jgi:hypothetical protein
MPPPYEAVVRRDDQDIGPIRLPQNEPERFIEEFNRLYRDKKMVVASVPHAPATSVKDRT